MLKFVFMTDGYVAVMLDDKSIGIYESRKLMQDLNGGCIRSIKNNEVHVIDTIPTEKKVA